MGMGFSFIEKKDFKRFLILGIDNSGKKKIMYRLKFNKDIPTRPEKGFFVETFERRFKYNNEDVCGQNMIRPLWPNYYTDETNGLIFVVDSSDQERIEEVRLEIKKLDENIKIFKNHPFLIFANKQDLKNSLSIEQLIDKLELNKLSLNRKWHIQSSNAITGDGLEFGLNWLFSSSHNFT
ncbi:ADP-ribosylation factor-related [Dictyostelium discoideum AX4]|uniref:ADP-ribosylation factor-related n=1 Tax=Dictyostelium discoideum TaxID=44689 RepID=Q554Y8_DICDI|nr:ADP-ribosylation factor-related [Dictyostelium discoideum AX4]EAL70115.2 ADP-ribosylation factor-related [Dictyostelium discoideum AX4]|eukprot:XP_644185.2 ADP-ribosylation factor-related [Dictyostelium discoideum AX4]